MPKVAILVMSYELDFILKICEADSKSVPWSDPFFSDCVKTACGSDFWVGSDPRVTISEPKVIETALNVDFKNSLRIMCYRHGIKYSNIRLRPCTVFTSDTYRIKFFGRYI